MSTACFRAAVCIVPFRRVLAGFREERVMGLCLRRRALCHPSGATGTRCRKTMAPQPVLGRFAPASRRAVARDRRGPYAVVPSFVSGPGRNRGRSSAPQPRPESVESEHAASGPLV